MARHIFFVRIGKSLFLNKSSWGNGCLMTSHFYFTHRNFLQATNTPLRDCFFIVLWRLHGSVIQWNFTVNHLKTKTLIYHRSPEATSVIWDVYSARTLTLCQRCFCLPVAQISELQKIRFSLRPSFLFCVQVTWLLLVYFVIKRVLSSGPVKIKL